MTTKHPINIQDAQTLTNGSSPEGIDIQDMIYLIDEGCKHFWGKRGGDPYKRNFNNRSLPSKGETDAR
tara:strand:- start:1008 stop:1211 length:204 start_codon:yes stop_codon:yes gene_type:complete